MANFVFGPKHTEESNGLEYIKREVSMHYGTCAEILTIFLKDSDGNEYEYNFSGPTAFAISELMVEFAERYK